MSQQGGQRTMVARMIFHQLAQQRVSIAILDSPEFPRHFCKHLHRKKTQMLAEGRTRLHELCAEGNDEAIHALLEANDDDLDALDVNGSAPIHYAVFYNRPRVVDILCDNGCWINQPNAQGNTPLDLAVCQNNLECVRVLVRQGMNVYETNQKAHVTYEMWEIQKAVGRSIYEPVWRLGGASDSDVPVDEFLHWHEFHDAWRKECEKHISANKGSL